MYHHSQQLPEALVLRWNSRKVRVRCPYCLYSHGHGFCHPSEEDNIGQAQPGCGVRVPGNQRRSDCSNSQIGGEYLIVYPYTQGPVASCYGWEVDTETCEFVIVDRQGIVAVPVEHYQDGRTLLPQHQKQPQIEPPLQHIESSADELVPAIDALTLKDGAGQQGSMLMPDETTDEVLEELYLDPKWRRDLYFSCFILRDIQGLEDLWCRYPDDHSIGSVDDEGDTAVLYAATEDNGLKTLQWLQDRGDPIHRPNHYGRTPLMEAALWGRLETVQYLSQQSINLGARDANGMQAVDLAADTQRNATERTVRSGAVYREPPEASRQREQIQALLKRLTSPIPEPTEIGMEAQRRTFFERRNDGKVDIYRPQVLLEPPTGPYGRQKAFATLDRGSCYPYVNAMSGYSHADWPNVLDNTIWTDKAEKMRALLGLPKDKSAASHVESQLLAYLLDRHSLHLLEDDCDRKELASAMFVYSLHPIITVSKRDLCKKCFDLFERFKGQYSGFDVTFHCVGDSTATPLLVRR
jgi:hypothetical protein